MFCSKCGKEIEDNTKFCPYCGSNVMTGKTNEEQVFENRNNLYGNLYNATPNKKYEHSTLSTVALVFAIISCFSLGLATFIFLIVLLMANGLDSTGTLDIVLGFTTLIMLIFTLISIIITKNYDKSIKEKGNVSTGLKVGLFFVNTISFILALCDSEHNI